MTPKTILSIVLILISLGSRCQESGIPVEKKSVDYVSAYKDTLMHMADRSDNNYFKMHCNSIVAVINGKVNSSAVDTDFIEKAYNAFNRQDAASPRLLSTYLNRKRPFIFSWTSATDGSISFAWLTPPKNWNPQNRYPVYIQLHGLWSVAANSIEYLTYPYLQDPSGNISFEDGYLLSPWGRGNYWYQGISETDIFECLDAIEKTVAIDSTRRYLSGHSMGGYGAWSIASKSPEIWAALGIYAGALWYYPDVLNNSVVQKLRDIPTYFVCGLRDNLLAVNEDASRLLQATGNNDMRFETFSGGHEYTEQNVYYMYEWMRSRIKKGSSVAVDHVASPELSIKGLIKDGYNHINLILSGSADSHADIRIFDIYGRLECILENVMITEGSNSLNLDSSALHHGLHIVRINSGLQSVSTKVMLE